MKSVAFRSLVLVSAAALCAACGSLFESKIPQSDRYVIAAAPAAASSTQTAASATDLAIGRPDVAPGLDTERIAVLRGRQLEYFRGAQWGGSVTEVVQALLVSSFQDQHLFHSVTSEQARVSSNYMLDVEVRDFQAEYAEGRASPEVRVTIVGRIIRIKDRQLVDTLVATASRPARENRMNVVAAAFEAAAQEVALDLARRAATAVAKDTSGKVPTSSTAADQ
jgi:cholesterol transport system auxiliary component